MNPLLFFSGSRSPWFPAAFILVGLAVLFAPGSASSTPAPLDIPVEFPIREYNFDDPYFRDLVRAQFATHPEHEPRLSRSEQRFFQEELLPLLENDPEAAMSRTRSFLERETSPALYFVLGNLLLQSGNFRDAEAALREALRLQPGFLRARRSLALSLFQQERYPESRAELLALLRRGLSDDQIYGLLAHTWIVDQQYGSALRAYENARMFRPESIDLRRGEIQCLLALGRYREARGQLDELIERAPTEAVYRKLRANTWLMAEQPLEAAADLEVLRRLDGADGRALLLLGNLYLQENLAGPSLGAYRDALAHHNGQLNFDEKFLPLRYLMERRHWSEAAIYLEKLRQSHVEALSDAEFQRLEIADAQIRLAEGEDETAAAILEDVLKRDPLNGLSLLLLGQYHQTREAYDRAIEYFTRASRVEESRREAFLRLSSVQISLQNYSAAIEALVSAQQIEYSRAIERHLQAVRRAEEQVGGGF